MLFLEESDKMSPENVIPVSVRVFTCVYARLITNVMGKDALPLLKGTEISHQVISVFLANQPIKCQHPSNTCF